MPDIFEQFGFAAYTPAGGTKFLVRDVTVSDVFERRAIERRRPGLEGPAPVDDTGPNNDTFDITLLFARTDSVLAERVGEPVYPDYHARFLRELRVEGTATYYYPGRGEKRVRLRRLTSARTSTARDSEDVTLSLLEDGEDNRAGADAFALPSAKSAPTVLVRQIAIEARPLGIGSDLVLNLESAVLALDSSANQPFTAAAEIGRRADRVLLACSKLRRTLTAPVPPFDQPAFSPLLAADAGNVLGVLSQIEASAAAQRPSIFGTGTVRAMRFSTALSIFEIAAKLQQPVDVLIQMNVGLPLFGIPAGVEVLTKAA